MIKTILFVAPLVLFVNFAVAGQVQSPFSSSNEEWEGGVGNLQFVNPRGEAANWQALISQFGGRVLSPTSYPQSAEGFKNFLNDTGVTEYDPIEMITPPSKDIARRCGIKFLLPDRSKWPQGAALALWAQAIAQVAQEKPVILNWFRTPCYNRAVKGAKASDHIQARSGDLDFVNPDSRRRAQQWLCAFWDSSLNMQVGLGGSVIHLGSQSPRGKRNWYYDTYADADRGKTCFD